MSVAYGDALNRDRLTSTATGSAATPGTQRTIPAAQDAAIPGIGPPPPPARKSPLPDAKAPLPDAKAPLPDMAAVGAEPPLLGAVAACAGSASPGAYVHRRASIRRTPSAISRTSGGAVPGSGVTGRHSAAGSSTSRSSCALVASSSASASALSAAV
ncbi:hypothetical protein ACFQQB_61855 [Nonomuraea rubra]|uniref:hypothetical protein n=1 Tax=Nonomuraea rubra TaxID=46180 RepID=UPI00360E0D1F